MNFHCPDSGGWRINFLPTWTSGPVTITTNDETGLVEDVHIVTNQEYLQTYGNVSVIMCSPREVQPSFAIVAITGLSKSGIYNMQVYIATYRFLYSYSSLSTRAAAVPYSNTSELDQPLSGVGVSRI